MSSDAYFIVVSDQKPETEMERQAEKIRRTNVCNLLKRIIKYSTLIPFRWHACKYMCFYCDNHFIECSKLKEHLNHHPELNLDEICLRIMYSNARIKLDITHICCTTCQQDFKSFNNYLDHLSNKHKIVVNEEIAEQFEVFKPHDESMCCLECNESFKHFSNLLNHTHKKHNDGKYLCELCGQGFWLKRSIQGHMRVVHDRQDCKYCDASFPTRYALYNHVGSVHKTFRFQCYICDKLFPNSYLRKRHLALEHNCRSEQLLCDICNKIFTRRVKLLDHKRRVHSKARIPEGDSSS